MSFSTIIPAPARLNRSQLFVLASKPETFADGGNTTSHIGKNGGTAMSVGAAKVLGPDGGKKGMLGSIGVRFMVSGAQSAGGFSLVEHPMPPRKLAAPLHRHSREDEYSFVLEGRVGALLGDEVVYGQGGDLIFKPRAHLLERQ